MMNPLSGLILCAALLLSTGSVGPTEIDPCQVFGQIYIEREDPHRADVFVYEEKTEAFADLLVFEEDNMLMADSPGLWYFTENRGMADFVIYAVDTRNESHFSVFFTDVQSFAGCK